MTNYEIVNESLSYELQKNIIRREVNWSSEEYCANQAFFKKDKEEKALLYNLKHQFRDKMRKKFKDWTKHTSGKRKFLEMNYKYTF